VFTGAGGGALRPGTVTHRFSKLVAASGLPPVRLHDLRHGAASLALAAGADLKVVQDLLGHASIVLTADTYISGLPELARSSAEATAALVRAAAVGPPGRARLAPPTTRVSDCRLRPADGTGPTTAPPRPQQW
jgi:integrase